GVGGRLLRGDAGDRAGGGGGPGAGEGCAVHRAATPARRGDGGAEAGAALAGGWVIAGSLAPRAGRFRRGEGKGWALTHAARERPSSGLTVAAHLPEF